MALKRARNDTGSRTPFEILESAANGNVADIRLWRDYVEATKGRKQVTCSKGIWITEDVEDVEAADGEEVLPVADVGVSAMVELDRRRMTATLLDAIEKAAPQDATDAERRVLVTEAARSVLVKLEARDWNLCLVDLSFLTAPTAPMSEVRPKPPPWVTHDRRKGSPGIRGEQAIRDYEAWRQANA